MDNTIFASRIKDLRSSLDMTQAEFAKSLNTTQAALSGYERGDRIPSLELLISIAQAYNISIDWLCGLNDTKYLTDELQTYTDLIKLFLMFDKAPNLYKTYSCNKRPYYGGSKIDNVEINIMDKHFVEFFNEWTEISSVRSKTPSGDKLYNIWLKDIYERFNYNIESAGCDDLPFC